MSAQILQSFNNLSAWKEASAPVSVALSDRNISIPVDVIEEFREFFKDWKYSKRLSLWSAFSWNEENAWENPTYKSAFQYSFSKDTRDYFQSLVLLLDVDVRIITELISKETFSGQTFVDCERPGWSEKDYDNFYERIRREGIEDEKNWKLFINTAIAYRMYSTDFERLRAFVSVQIDKLLGIYEV